MMGRLTKRPLAGRSVSSLAVPALQHQPEPNCHTHLSLDGVEVREGRVQLLKLGVPATGRRVGGQRVSARAAGASWDAAGAGLQAAGRAASAWKPSCRTRTTATSYPPHPPAMPMLPSPECGDGQGLQVQQLRGRRVLLGQDEVAEGHRQHRLAAQPLVRHHLQAGRAGGMGASGRQQPAGSGS